MSEREINASIRLSGESEYRTALQKCNNEMKLHQSQLQVLASNYRNSANSMEALESKGKTLAEMYATQQKKVALLSGALEDAKSARDKEQAAVNEAREKYDQAKAALDELGKSVDKNSEEYQEAEKNVARLRDEVVKHENALKSSESAVTRYSTQLNKAEIALNDLEDQQAENNRLIAEAKDSADKCATSIDRYGNSVKKAGDNSKGTASAVDALAQAMVASGINREVREIASAMLECAQASEQFEVSFAKVLTLADSSVLSKSQMKEGILELSSDLGKGAGEIAEAAYQALSAGVDTANVLEFVRLSTQLSIAGFTDAATSVDVLTTVLNAYGLSADAAESAASKLVMTQNLGKITVDQLGSSLGRVIPTAAAFHVNLDNISTAYAIMTANGSNAENTTTNLNTMLDELADTGSTVGKTLREQTGMSFTELMDKGYSLGDVLNIVSNSCGNNSEAFSAMWSSATAGRGATALLNAGLEKFNSTMGQMANASGAVAANYKTMANTAEASSRRVSVAAENLKIAVGDQLNPVLSQLKNAGAGIMEAAADVVSSNPALVAAITGVVTALSLLTAGLSAMMILKTITPLLQAFSAVLSANRIILVATAVAGLAATIATWAASAEAANQRVEELTVSSRTLAETVQSGEQAYADQMTSIEATSATVDGYISRLRELEGQGVSTAEQQQEYQVILDQIQALLPDINLALDEQTGLLQGGADALRDQADAWMENAKQQAVSARYKDDIAALATAEYEVAKNKALAGDAARRLAPVEEKLAAAKQRLADASVAVGTAAGSEAEALDMLNGKGGPIAEEYAAAAAEVKALIEQYNPLKAELDAYNTAVADGEKTLEANRAAVDAATEAYNSFSGAVKEGAQEVPEGTEAMAEGVEGSTGRMSEAYQSLYGAARESLDGQFGLFEKVDIKAEGSAQSMKAALDSQKAAFENYADNITHAMERGVDIGLVQKLSDGSAESMAQLAALVSASDEDIAAINESFAQLSEAKDYAATAMADVNDTIQSGMETAGRDGASAARSAGNDIGQGLADGIRDKIGAVQAASIAVADAGPKQFRRTSVISSPSKRWKWLGQMDTEGVLLAYKEAVPKMEKASMTLAESGYLAAIKARRRQLPTIPSTVSSPSAGSGNGDVLQTLNQILMAIREGKVLTIDGRTLVGATSKLYDEKLGQQKSLSERGAI